MFLLKSSNNICYRALLTFRVSMPIVNSSNDFSTGRIISRHCGTIFFQKPCLLLRMGGISVAKVIKSWKGLLTIYSLAWLLECGVGALWVPYTSNLWFTEDLLIIFDFQMQPKLSPPKYSVRRRHQRDITDVFTKPMSDYVHRLVQDIALCFAKNPMNCNINKHLTWSNVYSQNRITDV